MDVGYDVQGPGPQNEVAQIRGVFRISVTKSFPQHFPGLGKCELFVERGDAGRQPREIFWGENGDDTQLF